MKYCPNCGALVEGAKFCHSCGTKLGEKVYDGEVINSYDKKEEKDTICVEGNQLLDQSFNRGIASCVCSIFPIATFVGISLGNKSIRLLQEADDVAKSKNQVLSKKRIAVKILGLCGKFNSILFTIIYLFFFISLVLLFLQYLSNSLV